VSEVDPPLFDTTFVIHDWGSFLGYQMMHMYPDLMQRTISFDIGVGEQGEGVNTTYQVTASTAFLTQNSGLSQAAAAYWWAPCVECATWQASWPYVYNISWVLESYRFYPPRDKPLLFIWGNETRGEPRESDSIFFNEEWLDFVESTPGGAVVEAPSDHWTFIHQARFVNAAMEGWLDGLPAEDDRRVVSC